ncbi:MAG: Asp23/Gls24 family envelope stress response protein [Erysipelotrichaceae bacterium]
MIIKKETSLGSISIDKNAIATLAGNTVSECYGVVGMASQKYFTDGLCEVLKIDNYSKGIIVSNKEDKLDIDLYIIVSYGIKISEVVNEVQKNVKYILEKNLDLPINHVNVFVQGVKVVE